MDSTADRFPQLGLMGSITLEEMDSIKLMNRVDTKFVTTEDVLARILEMAADGGYRALETEEGKICTYDTLYYDTPELRMFTEHRRKKLTREKVRVRTYAGSGTTFLEIKRKNNHGRTKKKRMEIPREEFYDFSSDPAASAYLLEKSGYDVSEISPKVNTRFRRITLVNPEKTERLTIDTSLVFANMNGREVPLGPAVIIELKQDGLADSRIRHILNALRVKPYRISKYCLGTAVTDPEVLPGRFKLKARYIEKLTGIKLI